MKSAGNLKRKNILYLNSIVLAVSSVILFPSFLLFAQHEHMLMPGMPETENQATKSMEMQGMYGRYTMAREASGTSWQPDSTPVPGIHFMREDWMVMSDGFVNGIYDKQTGKREDEKIFSTSMFMFMAQHPLAEGTFGFRSMFSLDPLMGKSGYPLLLQTGETADGVTTLIDRQHPHDLFMELAATYSKPVSKDTSVFMYLGLPGEPALGPPAFMHRFSGVDFPSSPITHHWLDSTHITYGVLTPGYVWKNVKIEASVFRGREPNQNRWDIEAPKLDSAAGRISFNPAENWSMQASFGYIDSPEQLEPNVDTRRTTASVSYNKPLKDTNWQTTFAWGRNDNVPGKTLDGFLLESAMRIQETHTFLGRLERAAKDELFLENDPLHGRKFTVNKMTLGYIYDFPAWNHMKWGFGSTFDINIIPKKLKNTYGDTPLGFMLFARVKLD
jgi:hypothetical protein